ncbi:uncharacterized protein LOC144168498 [Haemaphysalis longicornis]
MPRNCAQASCGTEPPWEGKGMSLPEPPSDLPRLVGVEVACGKRHMRVQLQFSAPFHGIVFSKGHHGQPDCVYVGPKSGIQAANFDVFYDRCGTKPDHHGSFYENTIVVQYGVDIIEAWDEAKRLRCEWHDAYEKSALRTPSIQLADLDVQELNFQGDSVGCWMEIQEGKGPWAKQVSSIVPLGSPLTMVIAINDRDKQFDMRVKSCVAHDGLRGPIQLTDDRGCVLRPKMLTAFMKVRDFSGRASVVAFSHFYAFKFPDTIEVQIQCVVEICRHGCPDDCPAHENHLTAQARILATNNRLIARVQSGGGGGDVPAPDDLHRQAERPHQGPHYAASPSQQEGKVEHPPTPHQQREPQREAGVAAGSALHSVKQQYPKGQQQNSVTQPPPPQRQTIPFGLPLLSVNILPDHYFPPAPPGVHVAELQPQNVASLHRPPPQLSFPPLDPNLHAMPRRPSYEAANEPVLPENPVTDAITDPPQFFTTLSMRQETMHGNTEKGAEQSVQHESSERPSEQPTSSSPPKDRATARPLYYEAPKSSGAQPSRTEQHVPTTKRTHGEENNDYDETKTAPDTTVTVTTTTPAAQTYPSSIASRDGINTQPPAHPYLNRDRYPAQNGDVAEGNRIHAPMGPVFANPVFFSYAPNPSRAPPQVPEGAGEADGNASGGGKFSAIRPRPPAQSGASAEQYQPPRPYYPYPMPPFGPGTATPDFLQDRVDHVTETESAPPATTTEPHPTTAETNTAEVPATTTTTDPTHVHKVPIQASIVLTSGRFPSGPRSLKTKRNAVGPSDQLGVRGTLRVIAGVDLAFLPNVTRDNAAIFTGRYEEIIYGVCLPATGLAASLGVFVLLILCITCIAAYLYYVLRTYEAKSKQSFILRRFMSTYRNRKMKH